MPPPISLCILAQNEEASIGHALASARACPWCDEIVVFDSGSTDGTVQAARGYTDRVHLEPWVDFTTNRRKIVEAARNDWVFVLDADEEISPELGRQIAGLADEAFREHSVMTMPRHHWLLGRRVKAWEPDRLARLFDRRRVRWPQRSVHDRVDPSEGSVLDLDGAVLHRRHYENWGDYFDGPRYAARTEALAREMLAAGRRVGWLGLWLRPWAAFVKCYLIKGAILQGAFGLMVAQKSAFSVQLKYARLWHLQQQK